MTVSVIIPTLNEEACLGANLRALREQTPGEIIVVDGGSTDRTCAAAVAADVVLQGSRGRSAQMNLGAEHARGDVLLFLHADCRLAPGAIAAAWQTLERPGVVAGCFSMRVPARGLLYRSIEACASLRVKLTGLVYGDQGLFVRRTDFVRLGGFPRVGLMEDLLFSKVLRRHGRVALARHAIHVSARRWRQAGVVRQSVRNWTLLALAAAGVPPDRLVPLYPQVR